jgi:hypothetical protein
MARTMDMLEEFFGERTILEGFWPYTSPDFFIWGFLKGCIYENNQQSIQQHILMSSHKKAGQNHNIKDS